MKPLIFALCVVFAFRGLSAQKPGWQPSPGHTQMPIWPALCLMPSLSRVGGRRDGEGSNRRKVRRYRGERLAADDNGLLAKRKEYGAAVVVFLEGLSGFAIDLEGTEVCDWLTPKGLRVCC